MSWVQALHSVETDCIPDLEPFEIRKHSNTRLLVVGCLNGPDLGCLEFGTFETQELTRV
jgi:hypothetical protein